MGISYYHLGDLKAAEDYFNKARAVDETYPWNYYGLGLVYGQTRDKKSAAQMFEKALSYNPQFPQAKAALERIKQ